MRDEPTISAKAMSQAFPKWPCAKCHVENSDKCSFVKCRAWRAWFKESWDEETARLKKR